jgi:hypothetical protein
MKTCRKTVYFFRETRIQYVYIGEAARGLPLTASQGDDVTVSNRINRHKLAANVEMGNKPCKRIFLSTFLLLCVEE